MITTANVTRTTTWIDNQTLTASALNGEFNNLLNAVNIVNADIAAGAGIVGSKLANPLTGLTLGKPTVNGSIQAYTTDTDGATVTFDMSSSNIHTVVLGGNRTLAVSNTSTGQCFTIRLVQDATGSRTVTWFSTIKWSSAVAPTLSTGANAVDLFGFICTGTGTYDGVVISQNLS